MRALFSSAATSWRTTTAGVLIFVSALTAAALATIDGDPATAADWNEVITALVAMIALIVARDNVVSSEQVKGARLKTAT